MHDQLTEKEQQLLETEFLYRGKDTCLLGVYCEEDFPIYYVNEEMVSMLGYDNTDALLTAIDGKVINTIFPEDISQVWKDIGEDICEGKSFKSTHRVVRQDGSSFWAVYHGKTVRTEDGRLAIICSCTDMSTFIEQKEELEQRQFISEAMLKNLPGGYHRCSSEEGYPLLYTSERFLDILGWTEKELKDKFNNRFEELLHPEDRSFMREYVNRISLAENGQKYQEQIYRLKSKDGYRWVADTAMQMQIGGETFFQGFISDITMLVEERKQREKELARIEQERQQNEALVALGQNYHAIFHIDLETDTYTEISCREEIKDYYNYSESSAVKMLAEVCDKIVDAKYTLRMKRFFDLKNVTQRLSKREFIEAECITKSGNWHRARLIAKRRDASGKVTHILYVTQMIDDEKQYEEHLVAKAEHADYANRSKSMFISQVAHDIRTPMNSILGFLEIAEANINNSDKVQYSLEKIRVAGEYLKALANDVLDIGRMEDGRLTLQPKELNFSKMLDDFVESMKNAKFDKNQVFRVNIHDISHEWIIVDTLRLKQIYTNVMTNAIKYTPDGGMIEFTVYQEETAVPDHVRIVTSISDTGIGMSEEFMKKMFTKFERGTDTRINKVSGHGLGLSIVKQLVDLMGGTIEVRSQLGEGTTFTIQLEVPCVQQTTSEAVITRENYAEVCAGMHLLVAEDNELNREVITEILAMYDITCECTEDGSVCLKRFQEAAEGTYDAILMDMQMPVMNGLDATRQIRALSMPWAKTIPIIAMTANAMKQDVQRCLDAGMNRHLSKPVDVTQMLKTLSEVKRI